MLQEKLFEKTRVKKALDKARTRLASGKDKGPLEPVYRDEEVCPGPVIRSPITLVELLLN